MSHDVRHDRPSHGDEHRRYTCYSIRCEADTLVRQPWMTDDHWEESVKAFFDTHPTDRSVPA